MKATRRTTPAAGSATVGDAPSQGDLLPKPSQKAHAPAHQSAAKMDETLRLLEEVAQKKQIKVSYEALGGELGGGGLCKVKGEHRIIIDKRATPGERVALIGQSLSGFPLDDIFVAPELRELIERMKKPARA